MTVTYTGNLTNSIGVAYDGDFMLNFQNEACWLPIVNWRAPLGGQLKGTTVQFPVYEDTPPLFAFSSEASDVTPTLVVDDAITVSIGTYKGAFQDTEFLELTSYANVNQAFLKKCAKQAASTLDWAVRYQAITGTDVIYAGSATSRTEVDATSDKPDWAFMSKLYAAAASRGIPSFDDGSYVAFCHPLLVAELAQISQVYTTGQYSDPKLIYTGGSDIVGKRFPREKFQIANIRIVEHRYGKLYLSGGTTAQTATTAGSTNGTTGALSAGATTMELAAGTGISVGDWLTIGTLESSTAEQVQVLTMPDGSGGGQVTCTFRGAGNKIGNWGLKYDHLASVAVTEAANVGAVTVLGPESIIGYPMQGYGKIPKSGVKSNAGTVVPNTWNDYWWIWCGGFGHVDKYIVRGECAINTTPGAYGDNLG
jgi:N4-gp56 family major capsid protein